MKFLKQYSLKTSDIKGFQPLSGICPHKLVLKYKKTFLAVRDGEKQFWVVKQNFHSPKTKL